MPVPVEVEDAVAPDVTPDIPEVEDASPAPPVPEEVGAAEVEGLEEQDVRDGVVEPEPEPAADDPVVVAEPVAVPVIGGTLTGTPADEHTEVTAFETED